MDASEFVPDSTSLPRLRSAASGCRGCELYRDATQTVFGEGPSRAATMMIGEQPGDQEDKHGEPFVGPAGRLLDRALEQSGIDRASVYLTNAVKHFKFSREGKRRIHQKPGRTEMVACRPWLLAELGAIRPDLVVLLGATAAQSVFGSSFRITKERGKLLELPEEFDARRPAVVATVHPSSVLRARDRDEAFTAFADDLRVAAQALGR